MVDDAIELVKLRNNFYRDNYRRVVLALLVVLLINVGLIAIIIYQYQSRPEPRYFATSADGRITPLYSLSRPVVTAAQLREWANKAAMSAFSYNFANYRLALQEASEYFTPRGWRNFQEALRQSGNLQTVLDKKLVVYAVPTGTPEIIDQRVIDDRYTWKVQIPMLVTYQSVQTTLTDSLLVTLSIVRVSSLQAPQGIEIDQYISSPAGTSGAARGV